MPKLKCKICKNEVSLFKQDYAKVKDKDKYVCLCCFSIIYFKAYPKGKTTLFAPIGTKEVGTALGDQILTQLVFDEYIKDNPQENVIVLKPENDVLKWIKEFNPDKIFISEFDSGNKEEVESNPKTIKYRMINEICNYARDGIYPENPFKPKYVFHKDFKYAVMHVRNIDKRPDQMQTRDGKIDIKKNMPKEEARAIAMELVNEMPVVIVGNDRSDDELYTLHNVLDFRYELSLNQIAGVLENCQLFVGRDSGLVHLAAACKANIIAYNFTGKQWFPKIEQSKFKAFLRNVEFSEVLQEIKNFPF